MYLHAILALLFAAATITTSLPLGSPIPPLEDPFYSIPSAEIDHLPPGAIIRSRKPPFPIAAFRSIPITLQSTHQLLYKTTDSHHRSIASVVTVLVPRNANFSRVLSYLVAEDSSYGNCAPSYALQLASATFGRLGTLLTQAELLLMVAALEQGFVVIAPDHEGPQGAFLANILAGHVILDGIRAAVSSSNVTGIHRDARVALWGYSGGSVAASFAAELHPSYAPELNIVGAALGGTIPFLSSGLASLNAGISAGLVAAGVLGLGYEYPEIRALIDKHLLPENREKFVKAEKQCFFSNVQTYPYMNISNMVDDPNIFDIEPASSILKQNSLGSYTPTTPLYIYKPISDNTTPIKDTDDIVKEYCSKGASVHYERDLVSFHLSLAVTGAPKALAWLRDRLTGKEIQTGCVTRSTLSTLLDSSTIDIVPGYLLDLLLDLLKMPVGPGFFG
ncbi:hypothetical protein QQS21_006235 [Conoideocrella luteorostrata]|uniref:Secretory lipase n=1 Tax=Conoideocrella luteorostrata TaxID=1105319 RepID=A0AAJ0CQN7_9HYPO|nr:hypothetical protein QQS21_006235 [Conoideocrella luteorostrata]